MALDIGIIGQLALELLRLLKPDQLRTIQKKINELEKDKEDERQKILKAIKSGDIDQLNMFIGKHL